MKSLRNRTSIAMIFCQISAILELISRINQLNNVLNPKKIMTKADGTKFSPMLESSNGWRNNFCMIFFFACVLQISYSWIEVSNNVAKMKNKKRGLAGLEKTIIFLEVALLIVSIAL